MKERIVNGTPHAAIAEQSSVLVSRGAAQQDAADRDSARLQQALPEVTELKQALAMSQQQAQAARQQIQALAERNSRLRES